MKRIIILSMAIVTLVQCTPQKKLDIGSGFYNDHLHVYTLDNKGGKKVVFDKKVTTSAISNITVSIPLGKLPRKSYVFVIINESTELVLPIRSLSKGDNILEIRLTRDRKSIDSFYLKQI